jgi:hypothetical protein
MLHNAATRELHKLAHSMIFNDAAWPLRNEQVKRVWKLLTKWGVFTEEASGALRYTDPAARSDIDLLLSCVGAIHHWDIPFVLEENGYASEEETLEVWEADSESKAYRLLKILLIRAYFRRFVRSATSH